LNDKGLQFFVGLIKVSEGGTLDIVRLWRSNLWNKGWPCGDSAFFCPFIHIQLLITQCFRGFCWRYYSYTKPPLVYHSYPCKFP
jgi:hypothetical protein